MLTGQLAAQYVQGIQGNASGDAVYLQAGATAKHFFMFNYANNINYMSVNVSLADLRLTYLPAFRTLVQQGRVESVMCSYKSDERRRQRRAAHSHDIAIPPNSPPCSLYHRLSATVLSTGLQPASIRTCRAYCAMRGALRVTW